MLSRWPTTRAGEEVMRRLIVALTVLCAGALAALVPVIDSSAATRRTGGPVGVPGTWHPVFADEFGGTGLDPATWRPGWFGTGITGPVNGAERACYRGSHATVPGDGTLHLALTADPATCRGSSRPYTGALVSTNPKDGRPSGGFDFTYGVIEARVFLPAAPSGAIANWPAVWTDGEGAWPTTGEDDVMEGLSGRACFHFHSDAGGPGGCAPGSFTGWHTFAADWAPGSVTYYYDGVRVGRITSGVTGAPMFVLLDYTTGGYGGPSAPGVMRVDYVRVWQVG